MTHIVCRVKSFAIVRPYTLKVGFDDGLCREIDFRPILQGELYEPLRDLRLFEQVRLDSEVHTLVWPNGADFDPATLHDWPSQDYEVWRTGLSRAKQQPADNPLYALMEKKVIEAEQTELSSLTGEDLQSVRRLIREPRASLAP